MESELLRAKYSISINLNQLHFISIFDIRHEQCEITVHVTQHDTKVIDKNLNQDKCLYTLQAVVSPGRTLRYEGRETTASIRLLL